MGGEQPAGAVAEVIRTEFGISQPAVSQHLRVLRESGELHLGGTFQVEGNASGEILACEPPHLVQRFSQQSVHAWVAAVEASETATSDELAHAATISLAQFAPDLPTPEEE